MRNSIVKFNFRNHCVTLPRLSCALACAIALQAVGAAQQPPRTNLPVPRQPAVAQRNEPKTDKLTISCTLKYVNDVDVAAQADGLITLLAADEGVSVKKGEPLIQLDVRLANSELQVAEAELRAAEEQSKDESEIAYSKAAYDVANIAYEASKELLAKNAESPAEAQKKWLEAERSRLAIKVAELKHNKDISQADIARSKRDAANVQIQLRSIIAPFDGVVVKREKDEFEWVRSGDPILRLVAEEKVRVIGSVKAVDLKRPVYQLKGTKAALSIEVVDGVWDSVECSVDFVASVVDLDNRYRVWAQIPNKQQDGQWVYREGMIAQLEIPNF